jgi:hypothetical protein
MVAIRPTLNSDKVSSHWTFFASAGGRRFFMRQSQLSVGYLKQIQSIASCEPIALAK